MNTMKNVLNIAKTIITWMLVVIAVAMMIFTVVSTAMFDQNNRDIFGYKAFIVKSDSMSKTDFDAGDIIILKEIDPRTLVEGDIIAYKSTNKHNYNDTVTHKIRALTEDANGNPGFITYGTTTDVDDEQIVLHKYVLGKYQFRLPMIGKFFAFLKTVPGYIICILTPFLAIILMQAFNCVKLFKVYKAEKMEEIESEKKALEEERAKSKEMMEELIRLREQLGVAQSTSNSDSSD
jgi:signal peptidase